MRQRLVATIGIGVQIEGHRAAIADFQQLQPCAINNTFKPLVIGRITQQNTMAGSGADFRRQRNQIIPGPKLAQDFFHMRFVNHTILFLAPFTVIEKTETFELSFFDSWLCTRPGDLETFSGVQPQHARARHVLGKLKVPTAAKADVLVTEGVEHKPNRQFWPDLVITDEGRQVDT
ncbi:TPA: hypothetical protein SMR48_003465 [Pseudomonas putida]|nr:hypothetical protein [Pseudomonas putida]